MSSRTQEALLNDPEWAAQYAEQPEPAEAPAPRVSEWTPELQALTEIKDGIAALWAAVIWLGGKKPPEVKPSPRPRTAIQAARSQRAKSRHLALVEEVKAAQQRWQQQREGGGGDVTGD